MNIGKIRDAMRAGKLTVFADVMHGAAAGGLAMLLGNDVIEINSNRDPLWWRCLEP